MDNNGVFTNALNDNKIRELSPLLLAYIGDTVYDLYVRAYLVKNRMGRVNQLHTLASGIVNAGAQAMAARLLQQKLTAQEAQIFRLGKNAKSTPPKNACYQDYALATGLEAVIGYLYLKGDTKRTDALFADIIALFLKGDHHG